MDRRNISNVKWRLFGFRSAAILAVALAVSTSAAFGQAGRGASSDDWFVKAAEERKETLQQGIKGGEKRDIIPSVPGMPIPQTDRLKPPSPDFLMAKVKWGGAAVINNKLTQDWNLAPNDMLEFHKLARTKGFKYMPTFTAISDFSFDPALMPSILLSGVRELKFTPEAINRMRQYVLDGGMIICDSVYGSPWFYESALKLFDEMFPESRFRKLPPDHPLYHMATDVDQATYRSGGEEEDGKPFFEGLYIGSRIGVLVSKYGLGCGLAGDMKVFDHLETKGLKPKAYSKQTARQIGENLAPYVIGYGRVGEAEGKAELFGQLDEQAPTSEFIFAQVKHEGAWNAHPGAARQLLLRLEKDSAIPVNLKRVSVDLERDDTAAYPFLFFTGLDDFILSNKQIETLRKHVRRGGTLVINNALGLATFHQAAVREMRRAFPQSELALLPQTHEIFRSLHTISNVKYTPTLVKDQGEKLQGRPVLFGAKVNGRLGLLYSPYDLEGGWNEVRYPLSRGYQSKSAKELGCNIIMYAMTH
ncbi:DUF4159 domain-containing protein [Candidatus Sumerlaeota bacterium]